VELARLSYDAPHMKNAISLKKLGEQPGFRGAGAYEQSMYNDIRGRSAKIRAVLQEVEMMGEERRQRRRELGFDLVALAGYTNAGKSTLLNSLTGSGVSAIDQPFTTLSPTTRALEIKGRRVLLTDTVGFIDDLPHFLIKAFSLHAGRDRPSGFGAARGGYERSATAAQTKAGGLAQSPVGLRCLWAHVDCAQQGGQA